MSQTYTFNSLYSILKALRVLEYSPPTEDYEKNLRAFLRQCLELTIMPDGVKRDVKNVCRKINKMMNIELDVKWRITFLQYLENNHKFDPDYQTILNFLDINEIMTISYSIYIYLINNSM